MTERPLFECDVTGNKYGAKNDVMEFEIRRRRSPFEFWTETVHIDIGILDEIDGMIPHRIVYLGVDEGEVEGMKTKTGTVGDDTEQYYDRDSVVVGHYEGFFQFVERELLYGNGKDSQMDDVDHGGKSSL